MPVWARTSVVILRSFRIHCPSVLSIPGQLLWADGHQRHHGDDEHLAQRQAKHGGTLQSTECFGNGNAPKKRARW